MGFNSGFKGLNSWHTVLVLFVSFGATAPDWARASSFTTFLDLTRHTTSGRTPLDEWSARRNDLYLITHNTQKRQTSMPAAGFEPAIPTSERPQTHALDRAATGIGRPTVYRNKTTLQWEGNTRKYYKCCKGKPKQIKKTVLLDTIDVEVLHV